MNTEK